MCVHVLLSGIQCILAGVAMVFVVWEREELWAESATENLLFGDYFLVYFSFSSSLFLTHMKNVSLHNDQCQACELAKCPFVAKTFDFLGHSKYQTLHDGGTH